MVKLKDNFPNRNQYRVSDPSSHTWMALLSLTVWKQDWVTNLLHWAVYGECLVYVGAFGPTALAPDNHISCCVQLLFKLYILLPDSHAALPKLPAFLPIKYKCITSAQALNHKSKLQKHKFCFHECRSDARFL